MRSPASTIPPPLTGRSIVSCNRCAIPTDGRRAPSTPATVPDLALFAAVLRGEHALQGFRNREVRTRLFGPTAAADRRRSAQVCRLAERLHLRGLVAKIPRSRRWRVTQLGHTTLSAAIQLRNEDFPTAFLKTAA
jgi:hypothetical protein